MNSDVERIAEALIEQQGIDEALKSVRDEIAASHASGDNYSLSVWRDVRRVLQTRYEASEESSTSGPHSA